MFAQNTEKERERNDVKTGLHLKSIVGRPIKINNVRVKNILSLLREGNFLLPFTYKDVSTVLYKQYIG